jgi:hypothetical protein
VSNAVSARPVQFGFAGWTALVRPRCACSHRQCRGASAVRTATREPGPPNELGVRPHNGRTALDVPRGIANASPAISLFGRYDIQRGYPLLRSRAITKARMGEATSGRDDLHADAPLHTFRERSRTVAWRSACLAATTYNARTHNACIRPERSENDNKPTHGRSPVWPPGASR